jgi:hypothetical protein
MWRKYKMKKILLACGAVLLLTCSMFADSLTTVHSYTGTVGATVVGYAQGGTTSSSGSFTVSGVPVGATILYAGYYADNYFSTPSPSATFAGHSLGGATASYTVGPSYDAYAWNVTSFVTGNGSYSVSSGAFSQNYGNELVVVYSSNTLPNGTVLINEGAQDNNQGTISTSTVFNLASGGTGTLFIATGADDANSSGEQILFNGTVVGGPIDANLGNYASLFSIGVNTQAGANTAMLTTNGDWYGWDLAVLTTTTGSTTPEPSTIMLMMSGAGLLASRLRKRV